MEKDCLKSLKTVGEGKRHPMIECHKILFIEDDKEISEMLTNYLTTENYEVICAFGGKEACHLFETHEFSLVLLDLMIPEISGMDVMQYIRERSVVPVIIISAKDTETDKVLGLGLGADDYITKPFSVVEVLARIKANIRRRNQYDSTAVNAQPGDAGDTGDSNIGNGPFHEPETLSAGELVMNLSDYTLRKHGKCLELTAKEFEILKLLMQNPKKVYTKEQIYSLIWNDVYLGDENAVNVHISRLRNKIEEDSRNPRYIITVWWIGYKLGECL